MIFIDYIKKHHKEKERYKENIKFSKLSIYQKLEYCDIRVDIEVLNKFLFLCGFNFGLTQLVLKDFLLEHHDKILAHELITVEDIAGYKYFKDEYVKNVNKLYDEFKDKWYLQKKHRVDANDSDNKCDTKEWWMELYE